MKKVFLLVFLLIGACQFSNAINWKFIPLKKIQGIIYPQPPVVPCSLDQEEPFVCTMTEDELVLSSEDASGDVTVTIAGENGVVYTATETMSVGSELTISVSSLPAGAYTIYIYYANTVYVGQFEI